MCFCVCVCVCVCVCSCGACEASEGAHGCDRRGEQDFEIHNGGWRSALQQLRRNDEVHFRSGTRHLRCLLGSAVRACGRYGSSWACEGYGDQGFQGSWRCHQRRSPVFRIRTDTNKQTHTHTHTHNCARFAQVQQQQQYIITQICHWIAPTKGFACRNCLSPGAMFLQWGSSYIIDPCSCSLSIVRADAAMGFLIKLLKSAWIYLMMYSSSFQLCNSWTQVTMTFNVEPTTSLSQKENHVKKQIQVSWNLWLYLGVLDEYNLCMYVSVQQAPHAFQYKEEFVYGLCENLSHLKANLWLSSSCTPNFTEPPQNCSPNAKTCLIWLSSSWATTAIFLQHI